VLSALPAPQGAFFTPFGPPWAQFELLVFFDHSFQQAEGKPHLGQGWPGGDLEIFFFPPPFLGEGRSTVEAGIFT